MVFICVPLSRRTIQLSPLILTLATFLTPCHRWKGSGFKKGVCVHCSMPWVLPLGVSLVWSLLSEGSRLSSSVLLSPRLNGNSFSMLLPMGSHGWSDPSCYSDSSISLPLGIFHGSCQTYYELLHDFNTIRVLNMHPFILLGTLLLQMCQNTAGILTMGWIPSNFWRGKKLVTLGLAVLSAVWLQNGSTEFSFWLP